MNQSKTSLFVFAGTFTLFAAACSDSPGIPNDGAGGGGASGGSTAVGGGAGKSGGSGGSQVSAGGSGGSSNSGGSAGSANAGSGGTMPPPSGKGDMPNLRVLDWNGHAAAATFTFDDGDPSHFQLAGPVLNERGVKATFFVVQDTVEGIGGSRDGFAGLRDAGHELANHTRTHAGSSSGDVSEVTDCDAYLKDQLGVEPSTFAYPNVDITSTYADAAAARYIASRGGGDGAHVTLDFDGDWHNIPSFFISDPANDQGYLNHPDAATAAFDATLAAGAWRIITIHGVGDGGFWANTSVANLELVVDHLDGKDFWIDTFAHVAGYLRAQQALEAAAPAQDGATVTWTWTLPPGFPADVRLRVLIDGGTLTQGGQAVVWNGSDGYYPVDPAALSLTWNP